MNIDWQKDYRNYKNLPYDIVSASVDGYLLVTNLITSNYDINIFIKYLNEYELVYKIDENKKLNLLTSCLEVGNCEALTWLLNNEKYNVELKILFNVLDTTLFVYHNSNEEKLLKMIKLLLSKDYKPSNIYINNFKKNGLLKCHELLESMNTENK